MKKLFIIAFLAIASYTYAQEVPAWIDTTASGAAKYMSVSNAKPLPVNMLGPVYRIIDSIYFGTPGDSINIYNFNGKYSFIEVALTDTGLAVDSILAYIGIPGTTDTSWSLLNVVDLSDWSTDAYIVAGASSTKQFWLRTTRPYLIKLVLSNVTRTATQKGKLYIEAK